MSAGFSNATVYLKCDSVVFAYYACAVKIVLSFFLKTLSWFMLVHIVLSAVYTAFCVTSHIW
jgi:hypothetical protein